LRGEEKREVGLSRKEQIKIQEGWDGKDRKENTID